ncbi:MAG: IPExxxVDY family protein, partial [Bacteroidota bacterium]|nr:IPExxxVDY family protein [Bacteroidota bacterium]
MLKNTNQKLNLNEEDYSLIGIVSTSKEYKIAWVLNNTLEISLVKEKDEKINLINNESIYISHFIYKREKKYLRLIS